MVEMVYEFIANMVKDNVGREGRKYFPFFFCLFMFILLGNLIGLIPGAFTFTSHVIVTFAMAVAVVAGVTVIGIMRHGTHFFSLFVPEGVPKAMIPIMVPIEIISYLIRPFSLSIRLFVNMTAGHILFKVFAGFVIGLGSIFFLFGLGPLMVLVAVFALEVVVAILQAYVFAILSCMYLRDAVHLH
jgi:F-type H+-transporting ATPase subunit a